MVKDTNPTPSNCPTFQDCTSRILQAHAVLQRTSKLAQKKDKQINMSLPHPPDLRSIRAMGFPDSSVGKESTCNAGDPGSVPGSGRFPGEWIGYPLQYSWASLMIQLVKKEIRLQCGRPGFYPWVGKFTWRGNGYSLQYSNLENSMDSIVHGVTTVSLTKLLDQCWLDSEHYSSSHLGAPVCSE